MMKNSKQKGGAVLWIVVVVVVIAIAGYFWMRRPNNISAPAIQTETAPTSAVQAPAALSVTYGVDGFLPSAITIKKGQTVSWNNKSGKPMWVGSDIHPTHTAYDGTTLREHCKTIPSVSFDQCGRGDSYSFTFMKTGTFKYHNHADAEDGGTVVVTE